MQRIERDFKLRSSGPVNDVFKHGVSEIEMISGKYGGTLQTVFEKGKIGLA